MVAYSLFITPGGLARHLLYDPDLDAESGVLETWASVGDK
jgi:hypothetical protein